MEKMLWYISTIEDGRQEWKVYHQLKDIVLLVLFATLANADDWVEMEIFGKSAEALLKQYGEFTYGIPSHDTIQRVMGSINSEVFVGLQRMWNELLETDEGDKIKKLLNLDGKTMRGNGNRNQEAMHVVTAGMGESGVSFGQKAVNGKGKEIPAILDLLGMISVKNHVVTMDAIGTQVKIAEKIRKGKGDYVLAVKGNQGSLHEEIQLYFADKEHLDKLRESGKYKKTREKARGQIELREYYHTDDIKWLQSDEKWCGLRSIGMIRTTCTKQDKQTVETRYYISSLTPDMELFSKSVRGHWAVESMHWHLDVTFREDANQTLDRTSALNLNIIRKWALSILKILDLGKTYSLKKKRFALNCNFARYIDTLMSL